MERKGNCWQDCFTEITRLHDKSVTLVHGLPTGLRGHAAKVGVYPHGWLERGQEVWEPALKEWIPKMLFYVLGSIQYTVSYTMIDAVEMLAQHQTFGPWDEKILARDAEITQLILEATE